MDPSFWLMLLLGFIVGSLWITLTTISAERFGSKVGGLFGGLPSTVVIALLFIGLTQSPQAAAQATTIMPLAQGLNGLFIIAFMLLISRGLWLGLLGALLLWFFQSTLLYLLDIQLFWVSILGWLVLLFFCYLVSEKWMKIPSQGKVVISYPPTQLAWRAIFGGGVIALAILMAKVGGPLLGGIFSSFPAMFLSTLVITYLAAGPTFSRSVGKSLLISGLVNVPLYEIMIRILYPTVGIGLGTAFALIFSMCTGYLTFTFMKTRLS
jgi:hypothetical protein